MICIILRVSPLLSALLCSALHSPGCEVVNISLTHFFQQREIDMGKGSRELYPQTASLSQAKNDPTDSFAQWPQRGIPFSYSLSTVWPYCGILFRLMFYCLECFSHFYQGPEKNSKTVLVFEEMVIHDFALYFLLIACNKGLWKRKTIFFLSF